MVCADRSRWAAGFSACFLTEQKADPGVPWKGAFINDKKDIFLYSQLVRDGAFTASSCLFFQTPLISSSRLVALSAALKVFGYAQCARTAFQQNFVTSSA